MSIRLTNHQLASIHREATTLFPWAGSFEITPGEPRDEHGVGPVDVSVYDDTTEFALFEVTVIGRVTYYAEPVIL
jgi:hypothetical protein